MSAGHDEERPSPGAANVPTTVPATTAAAPPRPPFPTHEGQTLSSAARLVADPQSPPPHDTAIDSAFAPDAAGLPREDWHAGHSFGKYELLAELGRGGMGVVYRARDLELGRDVALKTAYGGEFQNPEVVERLLREARLAARLDHPGIVPIHDMGCISGVPYFAMGLVRGNSLHDVLHSTTAPGIRVRASLVQGVCDAVGYAHSQGVIHRDLKPSNVMVTEGGQPLVMDFGLAVHLDGGTRLTQTGQMLGTPQYMPPEQIDGVPQRMGPWSDVYSLGALLYEALTGRTPFEGDTLAEIVANSLYRDPTPPRRVDPRIPPDLQTICLKALEKEPGRRYADARVMADDLRRYLDGEAIFARPEAWWTTGWRRVRRRPLVSGMAAALLLVAVVAAALEIKANAALREQARLRIEVVDGLRDVAAANLDATLVLRRNGVPMEEAARQFVPRLESAARRVIERAPDLAEPHYHLGRLSRALLRAPRALAEQAEALRKEPDFLLARYERVALRAALYLELTAVSHAEDAGATLEELRADLARIERGLAQTGSGGLPPALGTCARGLCLIYGAKGQGRTAEGRALLEEALRLDPTLEEAWTALAQAHASAAEWIEAEAILTRALAIDRGYVPHWYERAGVRARRAESRQLAAGERRALLTAAGTDLKRALELEPGRSSCRIQLGVVLDRAAILAGEAGEDAEPLYREAEAAFGLALAAAPAALDARLERGTMRMNWALDRAVRGEPASDLYTAAEADLSQVLERAPGRVSAWAMRGTIRANRAADVRDDSGTEGERLYSAAYADLDRASTLAPESAEHWLDRSRIACSWATHRSRHGEDPSEPLRRAESDASRAISLADRNALGWVRRGIARASRVLRAESRGEDEAEPQRNAESDLTRAIEIDPALDLAWQVRANVYANAAIRLLGRGEDAGDFVRRAEADYGEALSRSPALFEALLGRGNLRLNRVQALFQKGEDATALLQSALDDYGRALERSPRSIEALTGRAGVLTNWALWLQMHGQDPGDRYDRAEADYTAVLGRDPTDFNAWNGRGCLRFNRGNLRWERGGDPEADFAEGERDLSRALALDPRSATVWVTRGEIRHNRGLYHTEKSGDAAEDYIRASQDYTRAQRFRPDDAAAKDGMRRVGVWWRERLTGLGVWQAAVVGAASRAGEGRIADVIAALEQAAGLAPQPDSIADRPLDRYFRGVVHYELACLYALASEGRERRDSSPASVAPESAAASRDRAFASLDEAARTWSHDPAALRTDADLASLHADLRWSALLDRTK